MGNGRRQPRAGQRNRCVQQNTTCNTIRYYISCRVNRSNGSHICIAPKPGYQVNATFQNMMEGSTQGMQI
eukprot:11249882-Ditylum_brightwellii.AAC.2